MLDELKKRAADAVDLAKKAGANDAWAVTSRTRSVSTTWRDGKVEKVQESTSRGLRIQLYVDGRYSSHSTTDLRPERLAPFINEAVALTRALQPDPFRVIPDPALFKDRPNVALDLVDSQLATISPDQRNAWCQEMDTHTHDDPKVISATSEQGDDHSLVAHVSSNGFEGTREGTSISLYAEVTVRDEGDKKPEGWYYTAARHQADLQSPVRIGDEALQQALLRLGTKKGPTGKMTLVVDPRAGSRLIGAILAPASAASIQQGRSFWAGKLGQKVFGDKLTVVDDPFLVRGMGSRLFDGEGISARKLPLVEAGVLKNYLVDTYYGRKINMAPTSGSTSNVVVQTGEGDLAFHLAKAGKGIYVTGWLGGNSDATTGDFSFGLKGHLIENGKVGAPVGEMNVTGNLATLFQSLVAVGNDPWIYTATRVPTLVFKDVDFSGA